MKGDQSKVDRRYQHIDLAPRQIEAQFQEALAAIKARRKHEQVDGWAQRPGYAGLAEHAPLADELPDYREARRVRVPNTTPSVWTKKRDRP